MMERFENGFDLVQVNKDAGDVGAVLGLTEHRMQQLGDIFRDAMFARKGEVVHAMIESAKEAKTINELAYVMFGGGMNCGRADSKKKLDSMLEVLERFQERQEED